MGTSAICICRCIQKRRKIKMNKKTLQSIDIFVDKGKRVVQRGLMNFQIDIPYLPPGFTFFATALLPPSKKTYMDDGSSKVRDEGSSANTLSHSFKITIPEIKDGCIFSFHRPRNVFYVSRILRSNFILGFSSIIPTYNKWYAVPNCKEWCYGKNKTERKVYGNFSTNEIT